MEIKLKNIKKAYGEKEVIKGLDLDINSGELISLVGPSGCGKSTTLFMLSGLEDVTSGELMFGDNDVTNLSADKREVGLVFQSYALYPHLTVLKNVTFPLLNHGIDKKEAEERAKKIIQSVGLTEHIDKKPGQLSGGQAQRVAIARAIVKNPKVLLLDEPLSNLDAKLKMSTILEIKSIQRQHNITTVFVTHDQQEALAISDRMVILDQGVIQQVGKPNDLYRNPANLFVAQFIGSPSINSFDVEIKDGKIALLDNLVAGNINVEDGKYICAIRPEAFSISESGCEFNVSEHEILGRDVMLYGSLKDKECRILIANTNRNYSEDINKCSVVVDIKDVLLFDINTKERVYFE